MEASSPQPNPSFTQRWQRLPAWAKWTIGIIGAILLFAIGVGIGASGSKEDELKSEIASTEAKVQSVSSDLEDEEQAAEEARRKAAKVYRERNRIVQAGKREAAQIVGAARSESSELDEKITTRESELGQVESELADTESELGGAEERVAKGTITDGVWQIEKDYLPGTYEAPGGGSCYWALLSSLGSGGVEGIIENGGFNKHQILTIESPYFESSNCGTWTLVE
jgi:outer membrane murein-binding lipoprotein Lpp